MVRKTAARFNLPLEIEQADVRKFALEQNLSIEMAARKLRHEFLARAARRMRIGQVALAHHADDQLEIFFLRLFRGSGVEGLAGMSWQNQSPSEAKLRLVRPLLDQPKSTLRDHAVAHGVPFREDATNQRLDIRRNRIRNELLPLLRKYYQPALNKTVLRGMELLRAESDLVGRLAAEWVRELKSGKTDSPSSKASPYHKWSFDELPVALQRRSLQRQLIDLGIAADFETVERLRVEVDRAVCLGPGVGLVEEAGSVSFCAIRDARGVVRVQRMTKPSRFSAEQVRIELAGKRERSSLQGCESNGQKGYCPEWVARLKGRQEWNDLMSNWWGEGSCCDTGGPGIVSSRVA